MSAETTAPSQRFALQMARWAARARLALARRRDAGELVETHAERVGALEGELAEAEQPGDRDRALASRVGLTELDRDLLWLTAAVIHDPVMQELAEQLVGARARRGGSVTLFAEVSELPDADCHRLAARLGAGHPLLQRGLMTVSDPAVAGASLVPAPRVIRFLLGDDRPEPGMQRIFLGPDERAQLLFDLDQARTLAAMTELVARAEPALLVLEGSPHSGRTTAIAFASGRPCIVLDASRLSERGALADGLARLDREVALTGGLPVIADLSIDRSPGAPSIAPLTELIDRTPGPIAITASEGMVDFGVDRPVVRLRWRVPASDVRRKLWDRALSGDAVDADDLAGIALRYRLGPGAIARAVASARATRHGAERASLTAPAVIGGVRHNIAEGLAGLAQRVEVTQSWDDLVLADDTMEQIQALVARVKFAPRVLDDWGYRQKMARGTGVAALFSGPPGTGKTMVAGILARELDLELYQVDLSQVVSKWIGETEKQLATIFDAAEAGHALLLFDEADALFGQRSSETKQAVDRYANLEVNFLLQRVESFGGITVLTTNLDAAIDRALKRRLASHIVFAAPDEDEREQLWRRLTATSKAPVADGIEFAELARRFPAMTGANIRNAALAAAFLAAADGADQIENQHMVRAGRAEYRSMGHILADSGGL